MVGIQSRREHLPAVIVEGKQERWTFGIGSQRVACVLFMVQASMLQALREPQEAHELVANGLRFDACLSLEGTHCQKGSFQSPVVL